MLLIGFASNGVSIIRQDWLAPHISTSSYSRLATAGSIAVVVDLLGRDRGFRGDVVVKIVGALVDLVVVVRLSKTGFAPTMLGAFLGTAGNVSEQLGRSLSILEELNLTSVDDLRR